MSNNPEKKDVPQETFYRVKEPTIGINFKSDESKKLFISCLQKNTANPYFELSDQFYTQAYGSFCGPTNISILLNTIGIDPNEVFFLKWRYYYENNIKALDIEGMKHHGMTITDLKFLLETNNAKCKLYRPICENTQNFSSSLNIDFLNDEKKYKNLINFDDMKNFKCTTLKENIFKELCDNKKTLVDFNLFNEDFFRSCIYASTFYNNFFMLLNIHRSQLGQEGGGHFMPIAAFDEKNDFVLLLDCARFKYDSRWQKVDVVFNAMNGLDRVTNNSRGFVLTEKKVEKKINKVNEKMIKDIDENKVEKFIELLKWEKLEDKAFVVNWLICNETVVENCGNFKENNELWGVIIPKMYKNNGKFKEFVDFLFMFDRKNLKLNILGCITSLNNN